MENGYIINEWALIHRNEMVNIPDQVEIHPHYIKLVGLGAKR